MGYEIALRNLQTKQEMQKLGVEISKLRSEAGISYRELSRELGLDYLTLKKIELGEEVKHSSYLKVRKFLME